jgi:hypothetical protein
VRDGHECCLGLLGSLFFYLQHMILVNTVRLHMMGSNLICICRVDINRS